MFIDKNKNRIRNNVFSFPKDLKKKSVSSFQKELILKQDTLSEIEIHELMSEIENLGSCLDQAPSLEIFYKYRAKLKTLLEKIIPHTFKTKVITDLKKQKLFLSIEVINKELASLLVLLQNKEINHLKCSETILNIKGLLVNILQ
ncbi:MAG: hypothetical protein A2096_00625 [Spirochaetes bacterium GWF1_41_5]|nr:MAG: hypothetical protein A2096_00625 [Spirochaetes bacterium GWF1_41_5]